MRAMEVVATGIRIVKDPAVEAQEMTDLMHVGFVFIALIVFVGIALLVYHQLLSDEEREKFGLGPKGQGRK